MKAITIKSKKVYTIALLLFIGAFVSFGGKDVATQGSLSILSNDLFTALEPGGHVQS